MSSLLKILHFLKISRYLYLRDLHIPVFYVFGGVSWDLTMQFSTNQNLQSANGGINRTILVQFWKINGLPKEVQQIINHNVLFQLILDVHIMEFFFFIMRIVIWLISKTSQNNSGWRGSHQLPSLTCCSKVAYCEIRPDCDTLQG